MTFKDDIIQKINKDFGTEAEEVRRLLEKSIKNAKYLKTDRIIRCLLFLANGNISSLNRYIENAKFDPRDVMLWAEYEELEGEFNYKRLRDFNKTFPESSLNVTE
jgi:hypothetical protein